MQQGKIFFLMGVSGSGKTTVLDASGICDNPRFSYVQSYTTRPLRAGEVDGEKYYHISREIFEQDIELGAFLEWATVHKDFLYGTKYEDIVGPLAQGIHTIKEIEMYGLIDIQDDEKIPDMYVTVFLDVSPEVMKERIRGRGEIGADELKKRLESAEFERTQAHVRCDHIIDASQPLEEVVQAFLTVIHSYL